VHPHQVDGAPSHERDRGHATDSRHDGAAVSSRSSRAWRMPRAAT